MMGESQVFLGTAEEKQFLNLKLANCHDLITGATGTGKTVTLQILAEAQEGTLNIAFRIADEEGLAILDMKDLRALLIEIGERAKEIHTEYGTVSKQSIGAIQRRLLVLEEHRALNPSLGNRRSRLKA